MLVNDVDNVLTQDQSSVLPLKASETGSRKPEHQPQTDLAAIALPIRTSIESRCVHWKQTTIWIYIFPTP